MIHTLHMGGGNAQDDWPELERELDDNAQVPDPDADPSVSDDEEPRGVPPSAPESGA
ncbi:hypothetical protein [Pseudomonas fulva]|nr:hypothetical protein [Pseudomonas fulva]MBF8780372.1 hypothetical protein [Pseudomonas fulva]